MKKLYQTPESKIVSIRKNDILTSSGEQMTTVFGDWDNDPSEMYY